MTDRQRILRYAASAWKNLQLAAPADLKAVAGKLKVHIKRKPMYRDLAGFYIITPGYAEVIVVNAGLPIPRQRFTIAHELGHRLLRTVRGPGIVCKLSIKGLSNTDYEECQCNAFAAELLMPADLVRAEYNRLSSNPWGRMAIMCERFGVSREALRIRLRELGLDDGKSPIPGQRPRLDD